MINLIGALTFGALPLVLYGIVVDLFQKSRDDKKNTAPADDAIASLAQSEISLRNALKAIETMRSKSEEEKIRLEKLAAEADSTRQNLETIRRDHQMAKELKDIDKNILRRSLGIDDIERALRTGKISGFITGILASLVAALIFLGGTILYVRFINNTDKSKPASFQDRLVKP
jgi:hypothetical protein